MNAKPTNNKMSDTVVIVESDTWRVKIWLGLGGLAVLIILAFTYRFEAGIIALAIGGAYAGRVALGAYHAHQLAKFDRRKLEAETAKLEYEALQARARTHFVETNTGVFVLSGIEIDSFYPAVNASKLLADLPMLPATTEAPRLRRLLDVYPELVHLLIVGPSGSGKTTVIAHLIDAAPAGTMLVAIDPHADFNEWPSRAEQPIGNGRDWAAIDRALGELVERMNRRYNGAEPVYPKVLICIDEWLSVLDNCPQAERFFKLVGSEARKVGMHLIISSISATVEDLSQSAAVRDNLAQLTLSRSGRTKNQAELKWARKDIEIVELPGPYHRLGPRPALAPPAPSAQAEEFNFDLAALDPGPVAPSPDPTELQIYTLYQAGKSLRAIYTEVYGRPYGGGREVQELRAILGKFGVKFETDSDVAG